MRAIVKARIDSAKICKMMPKGAVRYERNPDTESEVLWLFYDAKGRAMCSARLRSAPRNVTRFCPSIRTRSNGRCRLHSGNIPMGAKTHSFMFGKYSKAMPARLVERYQEALADPNLSALADEMALVESRLADLMNKADEGGAQAIFADIGEAFLSFKFANQDGDRAKQLEAVRRLEQLINKGKHEAGVWSEINKLIETKRKLSLAETQRLKTLDQFIPVDQANALMAALLNAVRAEVTDEDVLKNVASRFQEIIATEHPRRVTSRQLEG